MNHKKIGMIGCGNMAQAILKGILNGGVFSGSNVIAADPIPETREYVSKQFGIKVTENNKEAAEFADILFIAVKPIHFSVAVSSIAEAVTPDMLLISIAAGKTIHETERLLGNQVKIIRAMPNTPAHVGAGAAGLSHNDPVTESDLEDAVDIFKSFGTAQVLPEYLMDAVVGVCGSAPAYIFILIEAMADAAVADGISRAQAYQFVCQTIIGSAKYVLETGKHPAECKDIVCSPGGTTIEAVQVLERNGFRNAIIEAQRACVKKSKELK